MKLNCAPPPHPNEWINLSHCKFLIYWEDINTKFTIWQLEKKGELNDEGINNLIENMYLVSI